MKKLSIKEKQRIKSILKKVGIGLSIAFNVIFSFILIASLVIYSRGDKAKDTIHTEVIKSKYSPTKTYTGNIITTPNDIADTDILGGVYGEQVILSPYVAFRDFTYEINTYNTGSSVEYYTPNSISTRSFMRSVFFNKDGTFQGTDYNFSFDILTKDKTHPVIDGYTINYIEIRPINELRCEWWLNTTRNKTTNTSRYLIMNAGHSPYGYSSSNQRLFTKLFSGQYYFPKLNVYDSLQVQRYKGLISCVSQYSINYLDLSINKDITESISLFSAFRPMGFAPLNSKTGSYLMYKPNSSTIGSGLAGNIFLLYGDFHYNGEIYKELRLYYALLHLSVSSPQIHKFNVSLNSIPYTEIEIGASCDILYLASIVCANNMYSSSENPRPDINIAYPVIMGSALTGTTTIARNVDIYSKTYNPNDTLLYATAIADTGFIAYDNGTSNLATDLYNYEISLGFFDYTNRFYFNYDNGQPYYYIEGQENDNGISNGTTALTDVFIIINNGFTGLAGLMNYYLLPGITLGTLLSIPIVLTILLFVIKMFKR